MSAKGKKHEEPSAESLREMPEVDFSKSFKNTDRGYYYKKMLADGGYWAGPEGDLRWYPVGKGVEEARREAPCALWKSTLDGLIEADAQTRTAQAFGSMKETAPQALQRLGTMGQNG